MIGLEIERRVEVDRVHRPAVHAPHDVEAVARPDCPVAPVRGAHGRAAEPRPGADHGLVPVCHKSLSVLCLSPPTRRSDATAAQVMRIHSNTQYFSDLSPVA